MGWFILFCLGQSLTWYLIGYWSAKRKWHILARDVYRETALALRESIEVQQDLLELREMQLTNEGVTLPKAKLYRYEDLLEQIHKGSSGK